MHYKVLMSTGGSDILFGFIVDAKTPGHAIGVAKEKSMGCRAVTVKPYKETHERRDEGSI